MVISVFDIQVDTNFFKISLLAKKIAKAIQTTSAAFFQSFFILKKAQFFTSYY